MADVDHEHCNHDANKCEHERKNSKKEKKTKDENDTKIKKNPKPKKSKRKDGQTTTREIGPNHLRRPSRDIKGGESDQLRARSRDRKNAKDSDEDKSQKSNRSDKSQYSYMGSKHEEMMLNKLYG